MAKREVRHKKTNVNLVSWSAHLSVGFYLLYPPANKSYQDVTADKAACDQWALQETGYKNPTAEGAKKGITSGVVGGAAGAAVGAIIGAIFGEPGKGAAAGGVAGAVTGGTSGINEANSAQSRYEAAYALCMESNGYKTVR